MRRGDVNSRRWPMLNDEIFITRGDSRAIGSTLAPSAKTH
jgi:hypothetical protein